MKRLIVLLLHVIIASQVFAVSIDSLKYQREQLYVKYSELNRPGKELKKSDLEKALILLKEIVIADTKIINYYEQYDKKMKVTDDVIKAQQADNLVLNEKLTSASDRLFMMYIAAGTLACMLLVALILYFANNNRYRNLKKMSADYAKMLNSTDNEKLEMQELNKTLLQKSKELTDKDLQLSGLNTECERLKNSLRELQNMVEEIQKQPPPPPVIPPAIAQSQDFDMNLAKLERLGRMKELGIVTNEEFENFKKKLLSEL